MTATQKAEIHVGNVPTKLAEIVSQKATEAIEKTGSFNVAISGGSLPKLLSAGLLHHTAIDFAKWQVFLADERIVPLDHDDSNYREIVDRLPGMAVHAIDATLEPKECAEAYQQKICSLLGERPIFHAVLLGLGPDGHTCSLFPGHPLLKVEDHVVAHITDSPKPPPARVTLTFPVLNDAESAIFVCTGGSKAPVVTDILENPDSTLPGALVRPVQGSLTWLLDEAAAGQLSDATTL